MGGQANDQIADGQGRDFFISYTTADRGWAEWIAVTLEQAGYTTYIQAFDFRPGTDFAHLMHKAATTTQRTIAVLSPAYLTSEFGETEWRTAFARDPAGEKRLLIPVRVADCQPPGLLATRVYVDLFGVNEEAARHRLLAAVDRHRPRPIQAAFPATAAQPGSMPASPLPQRRAGAGPQVSNLPARNPHFTGRDTVLTDLNTRLLAEQRTAIVPTLAIHGLGGIGKTQTALEYAHRYNGGYDIVWWLNAEQPTTTAADLAALAEEIGLPEVSDQTAAVKAVLRALRGRDRWLLIYDNAEHPRNLDSLMPTGGGGHVLITSRWQDWTGTTGPLALSPLPRAEAVAFLRHRTGRQDTVPADARALDQIAELLGGLPLALDEAAAYLHQTSVSPAAYLGLLQERGEELLTSYQPDDATSVGDQRRVATVWTLAFDRLHLQAPAAESLLNLLAFLAPDTPRNLPAEQPDTLPLELNEVVSDPLAYNRTLAGLHRYSIITLTADTISVHRLVQTITRSRLTPQEADTYLTAAIDLLRAVHPGNGWEYANWPASERLLPHLLAIADHAARLHHSSAELAWLLHEASAYLRTRGQYTTAEALARQAITVTEQALGPDHLAMAYRRDNLGLILRSLGDYQAARVNHEAAIRIGEAALGPDHRGMAYWRSNLGNVLAKLADHAAARTEYETAIRVGEANLGADHHDMAHWRVGLGNVLADIGDYATARIELEAAIRITETSLGPDHPYMAYWRSNFGLVLRDLSDLQAARIEFEAAIRIAETTLGPDHPDMAAWHNNLGIVLADLGDYATARTEYEAAIRVTESSLGPDHPDVVRWRRNLKSLPDDDPSDNC